MKTHSLLRLFSCLIICSCYLYSGAQDFTISGYCIYKGEFTDTIRQGTVYYYPNATTVKSECDRINKHNDLPQGYTRKSTFNTISGEWILEGVVGGTYVLIVPEGNYLEKGGRFEAKYYEVRQGRSYNYELTDKVSGNIIVLRTQEASSRRRRSKGKFNTMPPIDDEGTLVWDIHSYLSRDYLKEESRFMMFPKAYEYPSDKFVGYVQSATFDTPRYALAQQRRKNFDSQVNDSLAPFILYETPQSEQSDSAAEESPIYLTDKEFNISYKFTFVKPDPDKLYYYRGIRELEDFNHVYFQDSVEGSPYAKNLWRFLDTHFAIQYGELTQDMYEPPRENVRTVDETLALEFARGTDNLIENAKNDSIKAQATTTIRRYIQTILKVKIRGAASPDGNLQGNTALATRRSSFARNWLSHQFPHLTIETEAPVVHTWNEVADFLVEQGHADLAEEIRRKSAAGQPINRATMSSWDEIIEPSLQVFRTMTVSYLIQLSDPLSPEEAVDKFLHDPAYAEGGSKVFSNGDYWNIYNTLKDTVALERLTKRIYEQEIKGKPAAKYSNFYAYVANRYLADQLRHNAVTSESVHILDRFVNIDTLRNGMFDSKPEGISMQDGITKYYINRSDHVSNLALTYFQLGKRKWAWIMAQLLPEEEKYQAISMLSLLCARFAQHREEAEPGLDYAWNASPMSRAVLAVELNDYLDDTRIMNYAEKTSLLWSLPDDDARKWYLLALVTVNDEITQKYSSTTRSELEEQQILEQQTVEAAEEDGTIAQLLMSEEYKEIVDKIQALRDQLATEEPLGLKDSLPDFLAYLQKSFDMNPELYKTQYLVDYTFDQKVKDEKNKNKERYLIYKYDPELSSEYRKRFQDIYKYIQQHPYPEPDLRDFGIYPEETNTTITDIAPVTSSTPEKVTVEEEITEDENE